MNKNIDLTKILEGCPKGTFFYSSIFGKVSFVEIKNYDRYPIKLQAYNIFKHSTVNIEYADDGRSNYAFDGEYTLFPSKEQRDWSKFVRFWDKPKVEVEKFDPSILQPFDKVFVRLDENDCWMAAHFSHMDVSTNTVVCDGFCYVRCIPYNDETKHLVGTIEDCPEYYKWWKE